MLPVLVAKLPMRSASSDPAPRRRHRDPQWRTDNPVRQESRICKPLTELCLRRDDPALLRREAVVDIGAEGLQAGPAGEAEVRKGEEILDAAQECVVVVRRVIDRAGLDELRDQERAGAAAARSAAAGAG